MMEERRRMRDDGENARRAKTRTTEIAMPLKPPLQLLKAKIADDASVMLSRRLRQNQPRLQTHRRHLRLRIRQWQCNQRGRKA